MTGLSTHDYRELLATAPGTVFDADTEEPDLRRLFTPNTHRLALDPNATLVRGGRGSGKTVWYKVLGDSRLRQIAARAYMLPRLAEATVSSGHGSATNPACYPSPNGVKAILDAGLSAEHLWSAVVLVALDVPGIKAEPTWPDKVRWAERDLEALDRALWDQDQKAAAAGHHRFHLILFDALEHLHPDRETTDRLVSGLLKMSLLLRMRTRSVRAKVFIRPDMLDSATTMDFPDASKLAANPADLDWSAENLYGLLFHQLGNADEAFGEEFRAMTCGWQSMVDDRYVAPVEVIADKQRQQQIFEGIAGHFMGPSHRNGYTYTWLPNHLQDGRGKVSPRSFLRAVTKAAEISRDNHGAHEHPLHYEAIRLGVRHASEIRVEEVTEDIPWVADAIKALEGEQVPIEREQVVRRWREAKLSDTLARRRMACKTGNPRNPEDPYALIRQLIDLGVMTERKTVAKLDLPDVYRIHFGVGRSGGISRHTTRAPRR